MTIDDLNRLSERDAVSEFLRCCGSSRWATLMTERRPFQTTDELLAAAESLSGAMTPADWQEAFAHHPKIGDMKALRKKFETTGQWAEGEQAGVKNASEEILKELAEGNKNYEARFGYSFIVCATGKSAGEMVALLIQRLANNPPDELTVAAGEQKKITRLRLEKLLSETRTPLLRKP